MYTVVNSFIIPLSYLVFSPLFQRFYISVALTPSDRFKVQFVITAAKYLQSRTMNKSLSLPQERNVDSAPFYAASQENMALKELSLHDINDREMSAMHRAAWEGDVDLISRLLRDNPRLSSLEDRYDRVPLVCAAENDQTEAVRALVRYTAIKTGDKQGRTALHWSVQHGNEDIVALLLAEGASPNTVNGFQNTNSPQEDLSTRRELPSSEKSLGLEYAWVNSQTIFGDTALHLAAARCNSQKILSLLVQACNVTLENFEGKTADYLIEGSVKGIHFLRRGKCKTSTQVFAEG
jgi:ankyrin repeat protein